ncbi:MAG: hypothetical protein M4579_004307 [Chaenotheca gracillima]|nr:MAG: hypothetical protein M4579_004307 [Chaenotheca gracillima]
MSLPAPRNKVFILGESGIESELDSEGVSYCGGTDPALRRDMTPADFSAIASGDALDPDVGIVLAGLDMHLNYLKLSLGYHYIRRGAVFLATNTDATFPSSGALFPGAGTVSIALINMLNGGGAAEGQASSKPLVMGKPHQAMMDAIEGKFKFDRSKTCM